MLCVDYSMSEIVETMELHSLTIVEIIDAKKLEAN